MEAIAESRDPWAIPILEKAIQDPGRNPDEMARAAEALGNFGYKAADGVPLLSTLTKHTNAFLGRSSKAAIEKIEYSVKTNKASPK